MNYLITLALICGPITNDIAYVAYPYKDCYRKYFNCIDQNKKHKALSEEHSLELCLREEIKK